MPDTDFIVAAAAPRLTLADPAANAASIRACMERAHAGRAALLVLPKLCITGLTCGDLFWQQVLLEAAERALLDLIRASEKLPGLTLLVGAPLRYERALYSCAVAIRDGALLGAAPLPSDDPRSFASPERVQGQFSLAGQPPVPFAHNMIIRCGEYTVCMEPGADVLACLSAFPADAVSDERLPAMAAAASRQTGGAFVLACPGPGESSTDYVYTGLCAIAENGALLGASESEAGESFLLQTLTPRRREKAAAPDVSAAPDAQNPWLPADGHRAAALGRIVTLQAMGLRRRMRHMGARGIALGLSGGLDSTLALLVGVRALDMQGLPRERLLAVTMPCFGTSGRTRSNAEKLAALLRTGFRCISIQSAVKQHFLDIGHDPAVLDTVFENAQARERTQVLMDLANAEGSVLVGTGDLSELALGWCTYNGDHMSMYGVNAGLPKTVIRAVISHEADVCESAELAAVLRDVVATPVSPELLPSENDSIAQRTEDVLGPYELHDFFLFHFLREGVAPAELLRRAAEAFQGDYDAAAIRRCLETFLRRFFSQQFKRSCMPDGPAVLGLSLSPRGGWQMPSDVGAAPWLENLP